MPERAIVQALAAALAPTPVHWGFAPFETAAEPPSLPLVVVQRLTYSTAAYEDMCREAPYIGDCVVLLHTWALNYEAARALAADVRQAMADSVWGWRLQQEADLYEPNFRAWRIEAQWLGSALQPD